MNQLSPAMSPLDHLTDAELLACYSGNGDGIGEPADGGAKWEPNISKGSNQRTDGRARTKETQSRQTPAQQEPLAKLSPSVRKQEAFRLLVLRHGRIVMSACNGVLRCGADAEDAFQATFFVLARKARSIESGASLAAWLHRTALRISIRASKRKLKRQTQPLDGTIDPPAGGLERVSTQASMQAVHEAIGRLVEPQRSAVLLTYFEGLTQSEAAARLGVTSNVIQARLKKARGQLRRSLALRSVSLAGLSILAFSSSAGFARASLVQLCEACTETVFQVQTGLAAAGSSAANAAISQTLAQGVIRTMTINTALRHTLAVLVTLGCGWMAFGLSSTSGGGSAAIASLKPVMLEEVEPEQAGQESSVVFVSTQQQSGSAAGQGAFPIQLSSPQELFREHVLNPLTNAITNAISRALQRKSEVERMQQMHNVGLALHNFHDRNRLSPPANFPRSDEEGTPPLLSWRVYLLPYLNEEGRALYEEFHLDEPWDSEHNVLLLNKMPEVYSLNGNLGPGMSDIVAPYGDDTFFGGGSSTSLADVKDGTSLTAMFIEAAPSYSVPWTKPIDFEFDPTEEDAMERFGHPQSDSFLVTWADAAVTALTKETLPDLMASIINRADNAPKNWEALGR